MNKKPTPSPDSEYSALTAQLKKLHGELRSLNSLRHRFLVGVLTGFGTVVGATVVVAIVVFILTQLASIEVIKPFIEQIVEIVKNR